MSWPSHLSNQPWLYLVFLARDVGPHRSPCPQPPTSFPWPALDPELLPCPLLWPDGLKRTTKLRRDSCGLGHPREPSSHYIMRLIKAVCLICHEGLWWGLKELKVYLSEVCCKARYKCFLYFQIDFLYDLILNVTQCLTDSPNSQCCYLFSHLGKKSLVQYLSTQKSCKKEEGGQIHPMKCPCEEGAPARMACAS